MSDASPSPFRSWLRDTAQSLGALDAGCLRRDSQLDLDSLQARFAAWMDCGNGGLLGYVDRSVGARTDPFAAFPWARSVVVVVSPGAWGDRTKAPDLPAPEAGRPAGRVSLYACGPDYHQTGREMLDGLADALRKHSGSDARMHLCVDTSPVPEVFLATSAGLGVRGINSLIRTETNGSRVFVGCLFTELDLPQVTHSPEMSVPCASCCRCTTRCPTGALGESAPVRIAQCRSFLSMEHRGVLSVPQQRLLGDCLFGCDECTAACPPVQQAAGIPVDLEWLLTTSAGDVRRRTAGTALERAGVTLLRRNAVVILAQLHAESARPLLDHVLRTSQSPVVTGTILERQRLG